MTARLLPVLLLASCGIKLVPVPATTPNPAIGRVCAVSPEIVLIEKFTPGSLPENNLFSTLAPDGTTASLHPTGERNRNFHAADLLAGKPAIGDLVLTRPLGQTTSKPDPEPAETGDPIPPATGEKP